MRESSGRAPLSSEAATAYGRDWAASWNRGDIEAVLEHFAEDCSFESPLAEKHAGSTKVVGKAALRAYWQKALAAIGAVYFEIDFVAVQRAVRARWRVANAFLDVAHLRCTVFVLRAFLLHGRVRCAIARRRGIRATAATATAATR